MLGAQLLIETITGVLVMEVLDILYMYTLLLCSTDDAATGRDGYVGYIGRKTTLKTRYYAERTTAGLYKYGDLCPPGALEYRACAGQSICSKNVCTVTPPEVIGRCDSTPRVRFLQNLYKHFFYNKNK